MGICCRIMSDTLNEWARTAVRLKWNRKNMIEYPRQSDQVETRIEEREITQACSPLARGLSHTHYRKRYVCECERERPR